MMKTKNKIYPFLFILVLIIIGYWQVSFFIYALKWDLIDVVLPFRYHFSECMQAGYFPFWNPFQQTGTPFYSDLQAPTYYPELLLISLLGGYGVYTMHILFILYLCIAAVGMYKLSYFFNENIHASLIAGLSYSFCGYIVGHGQHFFLLVGAAWLPFVVLYYIKLNRNGKLIDAFSSAIFVFLMVTGAYQALSIALVYLILALFIYFVVSTLVNKNFRSLKQVLLSNLLFSLIILLLTLPLIISTYEIFSFVARFEEGVNFNKTISFGQPLTTLISFVLPFSTLKYNEFFGNIDFSMINHYFGVIPLIFFITAVFKKCSALEYLILGFGCIILSMSFGFLPVREFMFKYIPLMNLFLCAAYIRIFGLFAFILLSVNYISRLQKDIATEKFKIVIVTAVVLIVLLFCIVFSVTKVSVNDFKLLLSSRSFYDFIKNMTFYQNVLMQAIVQFAVVCLLLIVIISYQKIRNPILLIVFLCVAEIILATQLNISTTVVDCKHKPYTMQKDILLCPEKFPIPINNKIIYNDQQHAFYPPFWRNTYIFTKQISFDAFSSFELRTYSKLDDLYLNFKNAVLNNHLFYFSDTILSLQNFTDDNIDISRYSKHLYLSAEDFDALSGEYVKTDISDSIQILEFSPNKVVVSTKTKNKQFLTMLQTNFKGWNAYIDDEPTTIYTSNFNYRTILLPAGNHIVTYEFKNNKVLISYLVSNVFFIFFILFLLGYWLFKKEYSRNIYIFIPLAVLILIIGLAAKCLFYKDQHLRVNQVYDTRWPREKAILNFKQDFENELNNYDTTIFFSGNKSFVVRPEVEFLPILEMVNENKKMKNGVLAVSALIYPDSYSKALIVTEIKGKWHALKVERQIERLNQWNEIRYYRNFHRLKNNETIKVYLWNPDKSTFLIDNIHIDFYE